MTRVDREARDARDAAIGFVALPVREQVLDRLADLMLDMDDILDVLDTEAAGDLRRIVADVQELFDRVNRLMDRLSD
jgi:hypothetical protein